MTVMTIDAQEAAVVDYSRAADRLHRLALVEKQQGHPIRSRLAARMACHARRAAARNRAGHEPDKWERTP